jgi:hypothetical protein
MKTQIFLWTAGFILFGAAIFALGFLSRGGVTSASQQTLPEYSLSPGGMGMTSGSAGYFMGVDTGYSYDISTIAVPTEELVTTVQQYLDRLDNPDLSLARLREFRWAYQAEVVERSTGRHAFGLMIAKGTSQISPKAGPNLFWNTKYGSMIAEVGGGYGMVGRMLAQNPVGDTPITQAEARSIAQEGLTEVGSDLKLHDEVDTYYGFYEFHVLRAENLVGEVDVNGYNGQVWFKDWGEPQLSVESLVANQ